MIEIRKVQTTNGHRIDCYIPSLDQRLIDAHDLMLFPALIDPHVHFRVPGDEYKETWGTAARAAIAGGVTTVLDMPNNTPACSTLQALLAKEAKIAHQLKEVGIPLRHRLYLGADERHFPEIATSKGKIAGLKIYMGASTGSLLLPDAALKAALQIAAKENVLVVIHAEDESLIQERSRQYEGKTDPSIHSLIRSPEVAAKAVARVIELAEETRARIYIAHVSSRLELDLIRQAKKKGLPVYAEATPHHLFLDESTYKLLGTKALVNPPLRSKMDVAALWEAINDETIDTIGTDHAPHTLKEKSKPYGSAPSGFPSIEFYFALLLNAYNNHLLSLEQIVSLTHTRPQEIFELPINEDVVLVDLHRTKKIEESMIRSKAKWSPYLGQTLRGWPRYTICDGKMFDLEMI